MKGWQDGAVTATADELQGKTIVIEGSDFNSVEQGLSGRMSIKLNHEKSPKEINLTVLDGSRRVLLGIYEIDGQTLRICLNEGVRPDNFLPTQDNGATLLMLENARHK